MIQNQEVRPLPEPLGRPIRLGVLVSGGGSNLANLLKCRDGGLLRAEFPLVIASRSDCGGLQIARNAGIKAEVILRKSFKDTGEFSTRIFTLLREAQVDLVVLAGYLCLPARTARFRQPGHERASGTDPFLLRKKTSTKVKGPRGGAGSRCQGETQRLHGALRGQFLRSRPNHRPKDGACPRRRHAPIPGCSSFSRRMPSISRGDSAVCRRAADHDQKRRAVSSLNPAGSGTALP